MNCPADGETLQMSERQGVEVDYCPRCRGVWLDRGELDKIIERASDELHAVPPRRDDRDRKPHKKKRSFLSDMFEMEGD